jgi:hypothetical protein
MREVDEDVPAPTKGPGAKRLRKLELSKDGRIRCPICPPNKGENAKRKPKHSSWKNNRKNRFK